MDMSVFISWCAAVIAGLAAIASIQSSRKSLKQANLANTYAQNANLIQAKEWTDHFFNNVKIWADEACDCIATAIHLHELKNDDEIHKRCVEIKSHLSSLIDRGRWYFPNKKHDEYGIHKEPAYRGKRQPLLNGLVSHTTSLTNCLLLTKDFVLN